MAMPLTSARSIYFTSHRILNLFCWTILIVGVCLFYCAPMVVYFDGDDMMVVTMTMMRTMMMNMMKKKR